MIDWQPIETAPIDVDILVYMTGIFMPPNVMFKTESGEWYESAVDGRRIKDGAQVTHWMPLPEPPKEKPMTDLKTDWERRADLEAEERRMKQIKEADAGKKP